MDNIQAHAYVELIDKNLEKIQHTNDVAKGISSARAFRQHVWLQRVPGKLAWNIWDPAKNAAGNFRGMVLSPKLKAVFNITIKTGEKLDKIADFVAIVGAIVNSYSEIERIVRSRESLGTKSAKLGAQLTGVAMHVLTSPVTSFAHLLLTSMPIQGYCDMVDLARNAPLGTCSGTLRNVDSVIAVSAEETSDGNNIYTWVNTEINPRVSKALGY